MAQYSSRKDFLNKNPRATAFAMLAEASLQTQRMMDLSRKLKPGQLEGKDVIIIGSGVAGLTTAYELLEQKSGANVTVLEALNRTGGRCLSLRTGDVLREDKDSDLFNSAPGEPQVVRFKRPTGDAEPYLNAGPGRIPSSHKRLLGYLKKFSVDIEVYVMNSESNLVQKNRSFDGEPMAYRRLDHNTRGWISQMVYENANDLLKQTYPDMSDELRGQRVKELQSLMTSFGELDGSGKYVVTAGEDGLENGRTRAGYKVLPGVDAGEVAPAIDLNELLQSEFWEDTRFYQPVDFLWQPTLFQPVGGMDQVQHAFAQQVAALGGNIHLNSPVKKIDWDHHRNTFKIMVGQIGTEELIEYEADYCFCNLAMPFLDKILSKQLINNSPNGLESNFKNALKAVFKAQFNPTEVPGYEEREDGFVPRFLACTTKVGWQAERHLWQGSAIRKDTLNVEESEVGVVPIFGGISWTDNEIQQIWYPSTAYQDQKGVLTGAYNFDKVAHDWGNLTVQQRLDKAKTDAKKFGEKFGEGLKEGLAIAWQNMPHIKGGWANWYTVGDDEYAAEQFNILTQGSSVRNSQGEGGNDPCFFIVGDQVSSLPGWQEGAIASAINAISRIAKPGVRVPHLAKLPDVRLMVEGV